MVATDNGNSKDRVEKKRGEVGSHAALKKGPWTTGEDAILVEYVRKHGEGNWNAVQRSCGLSRCGKSCRLRWANHLRPNLKKGSFTPDEERLIIELHAKIGNKWARMASQLHGRTDNEIKNYWNTRVKRLQRVGVPIYPDDVPHSYQDIDPNQRTNSNSPISPRSYPSQVNTPIAFRNPFLNFPTMVHSPFPPHSNNRIVTSISSFASPTSSLFGQNLCLASPFSPFGLVNGPGKIELPSIQTRATNVGPSTPTSSASSGSGGGGYNLIAPQGTGYFARTALEGNNSGLLEAILEESNALARGRNSKTGDLFGHGKRKEIDEEEDSNDGPNSSPLRSSFGMKQEPTEEINPLDDDLSNFLNNFPGSEPVRDWYDITTTANVDTHGEQNSGLVIETSTSRNPKWGRAHMVGTTCLAYAN